MPAPGARRLRDYVSQLWTKLRCHQDFDLRAASIIAVLLSATVAEANDTLGLEEAERLALENEPGVQAFVAEAESLEELAVAESQLPNPQLRVGVGNYPIESGGFSTEGMTQAQVGVRQSFLPGKTRSLSLRKFQQMADGAYRAAEGRELDVLTALRHAWLDVLYWQQVHEFIDSTKPYFVDLVTVAQSSHSVGRGQQQDVSLAELELSRLDERLIEADQQLSSARARLSQWVPEAQTYVVGGDLPMPGQVPSLEAMLSAVPDHPNLATASAKVAAHSTNVTLAEEQNKTAWAIDVGYGYRDGALPDGSPRSDFVSVNFTVDLPMLRGKRQDSRVASALKERRAAIQIKERVLREMETDLRDQYSRWQSLGRQIVIFERSIVPQTHDLANAAMLAYQNDNGSLADVMRGRIDLLEVQVRLQQLRIDRAKSVAVLANLGGFSL